MPIAIILLVRMFGGKSDSKKPETPSLPSAPAPQQQSGTPQPMPNWASWFGLDAPVTSPPLSPPLSVPTTAQSSIPPAKDEQFGHGFDRVEHASQWGGAFESQASADDEALRWSSVFEDDMQGQPDRWKSAFEDDDQENIYGFEGINWESPFPPKSSEPVIYLG